MRKNLFVRITLCAGLFALACGSLVGTAYSQEQKIQPRVRNGGAKPMFVTLPPRYLENMQAPPTPTVTTWGGSFKSGTQTFHFKMVGTNPTKTNTSTTVTVYIIPFKIVCHGVTTDPQTIQGNGQTALQVTTSSPIYNAGVDFKQGGIDVGNTQYLDAFQRANFWKGVTTNTAYHVLLATPVVLAEQTLNVPNNQCSIGNPFGFGNVPIVNINYFDAQLQSIISGMSVITPNSFPVAMTYNLYLSGDSGLGGCCIGGYHSAFGNTNAPQTYTHFTYIPVTGQFSQDVSALSHETGEWVDDPFISNLTPSFGSCSGLLEVGDQAENLANFGDFPYTLGGFTYHLQDLTFLSYFSGSSALQVNHWFSFQNEYTKQCQ